MGGDNWLGLIRATEFAHEQAERDRAHMLELAALLRALMEILDSVDRLIEGLNEGPHQSLDALRRQVVAALTDAGVTLLDPVGSTFNPAEAEAVDRRPSDAEAGTVVELVRHGGMWRGELLRPARVVVAAEHNKGID